MAMARFLITSLLLFNLVMVPSCAQDLGPGVLQQPVGDIAQQPQPEPFSGDLVAGAQQQPLPAVDQQQPAQPVDGALQQPAQPVVGGQQPGAVNGNRKHAKLREGFYRNSCPDAEKIVADEIKALFANNPLSVATLVRLLFHDCFVNGCDASLLLDTTDTGEKIEKGSLVNGELLKGVEYIDDIKAKLEQRCPGVVSCADIMAFAAMESVALTGVPRRPLLGGRRDGRVSLASQVDIERNLPSPDWTVDQMIELFGRKGFTIEEMVVLSGGHSIGGAHCSVFKDRIVGYGTGEDADPQMPKEVVGELAKRCKPPGTNEARANPAVSFDDTPAIMDNLYYQVVEQHKALLASDQNFIIDPRTAPFVRQYAQDNVLFQNRFADLFVRMASLDAKGKKRGEVRKTCRSTN